MKKFFPNSYFNFLRLLYSGLIAFMLVLVTENSNAHGNSAFAGGGNPSCQQAGDCDQTCIPPKCCTSSSSCSSGQYCKIDDGSARGTCAACSPACPSNAQCLNGKCVCKEGATDCCTSTSCASGQYCKNIGAYGIGEGCVKCPCRKEPFEPLQTLPGCENAPLCQPSCRLCG